jgi:hypothetical protein
VGRESFFDPAGVLDRIEQVLGCGAVMFAHGRLRRVERDREHVPAVAALLA